MEDDTATDNRDMDIVFQALADESRRRMLDLVRHAPGIGVGALAQAFDCNPAILFFDFDSDCF